MSRVPERVLLVGFMGAGKTSVGLALARRLGWRFLDFDRVVEEEAGRSIVEIFAEDGEQAFRRMEDDVAQRLLHERRVVLASGGGWAATPGRLEGTPSGTVSVWLRVGPEEAIRRCRTAPGRRPLLEGASPERTASSMLQRRLSSYAAADVGVDTDGSTVDDVTSRILEILADLGLKSSAE